jgi:gas vesicle protein
MAKIASSEYSDTMEDATDTVSETAKQSCDDISSYTQTTFEDMFTSIADYSKEAFSNMKQYFEENFYDEVKKQLTELQVMAYNLQGISEPIPTSSSYNTTNSTTYNSNQNVVLNNSIYGTQSANSVNKSFFTLP